MPTDSPAKPAANPATTRVRKPGQSAVLKDVNWGDFREHLATADQQGRRMWL